MLPVGRRLGGQCFLVLAPSPKIGLKHLRSDRIFRKGQAQTNRAPVSDVEVSVVMLEQRVYAPVESPKL
jgi:hypothetical protein